MGGCLVEVIATCTLSWTDSLVAGELFQGHCGHENSETRLKAGTAAHTHVT